LILRPFRSHTGGGELGQAKCSRNRDLRGPGGNSRCNCSNACTKSRSLWRFFLFFRRRSLSSSSRNEGASKSSANSATRFFDRVSSSAMTQNVVRLCMPAVGTAEGAGGAGGPRGAAFGGAVAEYRMVGRGDKMPNELLL